MPANSKNNVLGEIRPDSLFPLSAFLQVSGISRTRLHLARQQGIEPKTLQVGKRKFIKGVDGIAFIERLASAA